MRGRAPLASALLHIGLLGYWLATPAPTPPVEPPVLLVELMLPTPPVEAASAPAAAEVRPSETPPAEPAASLPAPAPPQAAPPPATIASTRRVAPVIPTKQPRSAPPRTREAPPAPEAVAAPAAAPAPDTAVAETPTNPPRVPPDYLGLIQTRLARVKRYPPEARVHAQEGIVLLRFVLATDGAVLSARILRGSGTASLDAEGLAMIERAAPFPPLPDAWHATTLALAVPVAFSLHAR